MTRSELISGVALVAALAAGGAAAMRPAPRADDTGAAAAVQPLEGRIADLEAKLTQSDRERKASERQAAEAISTALDTKRELDAVKAQLEDVMQSMGGGHLASVSKPTGVDGAPLVLGGMTADGQTVTAEMLASLSAQPSPYGRPLAAGPAPEDTAAVRAALAKIKEEDDKKQQEEREQRRKDQQKRRLDQMAERLQLTPQQAEQVGALWDEAQAQRTQMFEAMRADGGAGQGGMDRNQMREQMDAMRKDEEAKMNAILTAAQQAEYAKMQQEQQGRGGRGGAMGGGFGGGMGGGGTGGGGRQGGGGRGGRGG